MAHVVWYIIDMNESKQQTAIVEALGWERFPDKDEGFGHEYWARFDSDSHFLEDTCSYGGKLPNYGGDLNAMHKAIETLTDERDRLAKAMGEAKRGLESCWHTIECLKKERRGFLNALVQGDSTDLETNDGYILGLIEELKTERAEGDLT